MARSPYPIDPALTAIAVAYKPQGMIADIVVPRITVGKQDFKWLVYPLDAFYNLPETRVGRRSKPNQVTLDATEVTMSTIDHGLDGGVPQADIDNADERYDPLGNEVELIMSLVANRREVRAARLIHSAATYAVGLKATLSGSSQFSDPTSTPIATVSAALDLPLLRPNQMVFNQEGWTAFRRHPEIIEAALGTGAKKGMATRQQVAELFEVDEVVVGSARANTANRGQAATLTRTWGKHLALTYKSPTPQANGSPTFAGTFQWGGPVSMSGFDKDIGLRGGTAVRSGESVLEATIATQAGYFFENAFA
jgi:hypothetical protein